MTQSQPTISSDLDAFSLQNSKKKDAIPDRNRLIDRKRFLKELEELLGLEFVKSTTATQTTLVVINRARLRDVAFFMEKNHYQIESIWASDHESFFELNYLYSFCPYLSFSHIIIQAQNDKSVEVPSITDIFIKATYFERNLTNRLGIRFQEIKKLRSSNENKDQSVMFIPFQITVPSFKKNPLKFGIYHPIHEKNHYFNFQIENGIIRQTEIRDGWLYKKIQPQLEQRNPISGYSGLFEQISANSNVHLHLAYYHNLEFLTTKEISNKVKYIRTLLAELERIKSHLVWFVNFADILSFNQKAINIYSFYQDLIIQLEKYFLNADLKNCVKYGSALDLGMEQARRLLKGFKQKGNLLFDEIYGLVYRSFTEEKCCGIGVISKDNAMKFGLTGPNVRGSGIANDLRANNPYLIYLTGEVSQIWNVITFKDGDVFARAQVRLWEIRDSIEIIKHILYGLSSYERTIPIEEIPQKIEIEPAKSLFAQVESPQGALGVYLSTQLKTSDSKFHTVRLIAPDAVNFAALGYGILNNEEARNIPLIVHSLDLNFHMIDL